MFSLLPEQGTKTAAVRQGISVLRAQDTSAGFDERTDFLFSFRRPVCFRQYTREPASEMKGVRMLRSERPRLHFDPIPVELLRIRKLSEFAKQAGQRFLTLQRVFVDAPCARSLPLKAA